MRERPFTAVIAGVAAVVAWAAGPAMSAPAEDQGATRVFAWGDDRIAESSGLVVVGDRFVTVNDSGNLAELYVVDPTTGDTVDTVPWAGTQVDVEALAPGPDGSVWVADIGDNREERERITVTRVPVDGSSTTTYALGYPDGPHNAETLLSHPDTGRLFIVTKSLVGGEVFALPRQLKPGKTNALESVGTVPGLLTDGAFWPDGDHVLLRGYGRAFLYSFPELRILGSFELPDQQQGETIAVTPDERIYVGSEGVGTPVWEVTLPDELAEKLGQMPPSPSPTDGPSETSSPTASPSQSEPSSSNLEADSETEGSGATAALLGAGAAALLLAGATGWWWARRRQT